MPFLSGYQIALIVTLVLNLLIWLLVICLRLFCFKPSRRRSERGTGRSRWGRRSTSRAGYRQQTTGSLLCFANRALIPDEGEENPYNISANLDIPPSYEEATKHDLLRVNQVTSVQTQCIVPQRISRRPFVYEQPVVLTVPEERTSTSETRLLTSLSPLPGYQDPPNMTSLTRSTNRHSACRLEGEDVSIGVVPHSSILEEIDPQTDANHQIAVELSDGAQLGVQSQA